MNDRLRQVLVVLIGLPLSLAVGVSLIYLLLRLEGWVQTAAALALFAGGVFVVVWTAVRRKKGEALVGSLLNILHKDVDPVRFIKESEKALQKTKNRALRNTLSLNLAVGYEATGDYDSAIRVMQGMPISTADKVSKAMFYNNLAMFHAEKGAASDGVLFYNHGKTYYKKADKQIPKAYLTLTRALLYFAEERYSEAIKSFEKARQSGFDDRHTLSKLQLFYARALLKEGRTKEAKNELYRLLQKRTYPYLLAAAKVEMEHVEAEKK